MKTKQPIPYPMPADQLEPECRALFGEGWKAILSEKLNVTQRAVNMWASGQRPIPGALVFALNLKKGVK